MREPAATDIAAAIAALSPEPRPGSASKPGLLDPAALEDATRVLGPGPVAWAVEWAGRALESLVLKDSKYADLPAQAVGRACEGMLLEILARLDGLDLRSDLTDAYRHVAISAAELAVPFADVVADIRDCQRIWLEQLLARMRPTLSTESLAAVQLTVVEVIDRMITLVVGDYMVERERLAEGRAAWQRAAVQAVLDRRPIDIGRAERDLGLTLAHHHTAIVLWRPGGSAGPRLSRVAAQLADRLPGATLLTVNADGERLWAWLSCPRRPGEREWKALTSVRPALAETRVAIGAPSPGVDGFRRTHLQALDVARVVESSPAPGAVTDWHTVSLPAMVCADLERVRWYVEATLGPLAHDDPAADEYRATLLSYLETGQSLVRTAAEQHVHRNTIVYRMRRIEELLPMPLTEERLKIHLALRLAAHYGAEVLQRS